MRQIDFHFNVERPSNYACRFIAMCARRGFRLAVWHPDRLVLEPLFDELWSFDDQLFIPHCFAEDADLRGECHVVFGTDLKALSPSDGVLLLGPEVPADWSRELAPFERGFEIIGLEPELVEAGRRRYKIYRSDPQLVIKAYDRKSA